MKMITKKNIFFKIPPRIREILFYINFFKNPKKKIIQIKEIKKMYDNFKKDFGEYEKNKKIIYNTFKKILLKKNDGAELAKEFYTDNLEIVKKNKIDEKRIILICLVKNDLRRIKEFYKHYTDIGITNFVFIDNNSTDGTFEFLEEQENTTIFKTFEKYTTIRRQAWISKVLAYYGYNKWFLIVDSDEFLVYSDCERVKIDRFIKKMEEKKEYRIKSLMIDMYADAKFLEIKKDDEKSTMEKYCFFDSDTYYCQTHNCFEAIVGGMRNRVFGKFENIVPFLIKYPIFFYEKGDIQYNSHFSYPFYKNFNKEINTALLHYKFLPEDLEKIKERVKEKNYALGSKEYNAYLKAYQENKNLNLKYDKSQKYQNSSDLEKIKFINKIDWSE